MKNLGQMMKQAQQMQAKMAEMQAALEHRRRTGEGQLVEVPQVEVAACVAAEPVIEYSMNAIVQPREGNRCRGYLQGVYPTAADDEWGALCVRDDDDWAGRLRQRVPLGNDNEGFEKTCVHR